MYLVASTCFHTGKEVCQASCSCWVVRSRLLGLCLVPVHKNHNFERLSMLTYIIYSPPDGTSLSSLLFVFPLNIMACFLVNKVIKEKKQNSWITPWTASPPQCNLHIMKSWRVVMQNSPTIFWWATDHLLHTINTGCVKAPITTHYHPNHSLALWLLCSCWLDDRVWILEWQICLPNPVWTLP